MARITLPDEYAEIAGSEGVLGDPLGEPAYLYCRSSSRTQTEEGKESLSRQLVFADERGKRDGYYVPADMVYWDVWTGKDAERPAFYEMLADVKSDKRSDIVFVDDTDRLSRNKAVYYVLSYELTKYGLAPVFESEEDEMVRHIKLIFDELELEKRRYRTHQANKAKARKGYVNTRIAPFGHDLTENKKQLEVNENEAHWIRQMSSWIRVEKKSLRWVGRQLEKNNVLTSHRKKTWWPATVKRVLTNETIKGVFIANRLIREKVWEGGKQKSVIRHRPKEEWIEVKVPAIISEEEYDELQRALDEISEQYHYPDRKNDWLLAGISRCAQCDYAIRTDHTTSYYISKAGEKRTYRHQYYRCSHHSHPNIDCDRESVRRDDMERYFLEALNQLFMDIDVWERAFEEETDELERYQDHKNFHTKQIAELEKQYAELIDMAVGERSATARRLFDQKREQIERSIEQHQEQLEIVEGRLRNIMRVEDKREIVQEACVQIQEMGGISGLEYEAQKELVRLLVDKVYIDTKEEWFRIEGVLGGEFAYGEGEVSAKMLQTGRRLSSPRPSKAGAFWASSTA